MKIKTALILCAGFGKRLLPLTNEIPKPLLEINNNKLLDNTINFILQLGIKQIKINTFAYYQPTRINILLLEAN